MEVKKRLGNIVDFDCKKIKIAIEKALEANNVDIKISKGLVDNVCKRVEEKEIEIISIEEIQDIVERIIMEAELYDVAKSYILYRERHKNLRNAKKFILGIKKDEIKLPFNATEVLKKRYLLKDKDGNVTETPQEMFRRVAWSISFAEKKYNNNQEGWGEKFYQIMSEGKFLPNSPTLMNAGTDLQQLAACFVLPIEDSISGIFDAVKYAAIIHKTGGGTGFSFSRLRPVNDVVRTTGGIASGPVSFMRVFDVATDVIKQGGKRRGANMGVLRIDHPNITDFIMSKEREGKLTNFNISVAITDEFMEKVRKKEAFYLRNPRNGEKVKKMDANGLYKLIVTKAWETGDPGIIFIDRINRLHTMKKLGNIEATNPCGEQPLLPNEACNLGSINLSKFVRNNSIDYDDLEKTVNLSVRFLDDVIDVSLYPLPEIGKIVRNNRKIGLGVMGFADMLAMLKIPYNSQKAISVAEDIMSFINKMAKQASISLGKERGTFPNWKFSQMAENNEQPRRNATLTTIAPTGSISIIAGTTSGIEPFFDIVFIRNVLNGSRFLEINPVFEDYLKREGINRNIVLSKISEGKHLKSIEGISDIMNNIFVTAHDIDPKWHIKIQSAFQKYTDNAVSKTVNFPENSTPTEIEKVYNLAYETGCKGTTIYRDGSKTEQVLEKPKDILSQLNIVDSEFAGGCETCKI